MEDLLTKELFGKKIGKEINPKDSITTFGHFRGSGAAQDYINKEIRNVVGGIEKVDTCPCIDYPHYGIVIWWK